MRRGLFTLLILLSLVLAPTAVFAQDEPVMPPVACGSLAEEDCDFLKESTQVMQGLSSQSAAIAIDLALSNVPNLPSDLAVTMDIDGDFSVDPELTARMNAAAFGEQDDAEAAMQEMMDLVVDFYYDLAFDMTFDMSISDDIAQLIAQTGGAAVPTELSLPMRMVDGFFYMNLDDLADKVEGAEEVQGWIGIDYGTLISDAVGQAMGQMGGEDETSEIMGMSILNSFNMSLNKDLQEAGIAYTEVERLDDVEVDGAPAAQFLSTFDLAGFITDPAFIDMMVQQVKMQMDMQAAMGQEVPPITDADIQMITDALPMFAPMLLSGLQFETVNTIDLETKHVLGSETNMSWELGTILMMASAAMEGGAPMRPGRGADAPLFEMRLSSTNSGFGEEVVVEVPEDVQIIPLEELQSSETM